jgi:putative membrane protein
VKHLPYDKFDDEELVLRDYLALDRTILANERTLLSYARTALVLLVTGASLMQFFPSPMLIAFGVLSAFLGVIVTAAGAYSYLRVRSSYLRLLQHEEP